MSTADYLNVEARLTVEEKAALASHLAAGLDANRGEDFAQAEAILRLMTWNAEPQVVEAMAKAAAGNPHTPRSLAWALANDDDAPAKSVLEACTALSDEDLVGIIQTSENAPKMRAIARRPAVSAEVSRSLVDHGDEETVHTLLVNARAEISEDALGTALDRFGQSERIQAGVVDRPAVSAPLAQRLAKLAAQTSVPAVMPGYVEDRSDAEWEMHLSRMIADKALKETTLVRELCLGNFELFARGLSALSKAPYAEVCAAVFKTPPVLIPFWQSAALPAGWLPVAAATVAALIQIDRTANKADRQLFARNVVDRALANLKAQKIALTDAQQRVFAGAR